MSATYLHTDPPTPDYELHGWHCTYHNNFCHNPLDCDFIPLWRLKQQPRGEAWSKQYADRVAAGRDPRPGIDPDVDSKSWRMDHGG